MKRECIIVQLLSEPSQPDSVNEAERDIETKTKDEFDVKYA